MKTALITKSSNASSAEANFAGVTGSDRGSKRALDVSTVGSAVGTANTTLTSVNDAATSQALLAANANRLGFSLFNDSTEVAYVGLGVTPTTSSFNFKIAAGGFYEATQGLIFTGAINAIWAADAAGAMKVTEYA
ncbi:MAG TPA: hypothetical protein VMZ26_17490 [Pyrinomonadaceae bacterium]|nr:hypothetical protein [Pyrinomonadaceae bacterium]